MQNCASHKMEEQKMWFLRRQGAFFYKMRRPPSKMKGTWLKSGNVKNVGFHHLLLEGQGSPKGVLRVNSGAKQMENTWLFVPMYSEANFRIMLPMRG